MSTQTEENEIQNRYLSLKEKKKKEERLRRKEMDLRIIKLLQDVLDQSNVYVKELRKA